MKEREISEEKVQSLSTREKLGVISLIIEDGYLDDHLDDAVERMQSILFITSNGKNGLPWSVDTYIQRYQELKPFLKQKRHQKTDH